MDGTVSKIPYAGHAEDLSPVGALSKIRGIIEHEITHNPRSLQKRIGPSELGTPCDHCLAAKLAGWETSDLLAPAWLPFIGTAVHAAIADAIALDFDARYLIEQKVTVGEVGGQIITGSCDLYDTVAGLVLDHKIVGTSKLRSVKAHGPGDTYRRQAHLYGLGWENAGKPPKHVAIWFLPRNDVNGFNGGLLWYEEYQPQVALDALERANRIAKNLQLLERLNVAKRDAWISSRPRAPDCFDCGRYADKPPGWSAPGHSHASILPIDPSDPFAI